MSVPVIDARLLAMTGLSGFFPSVGSIETPTPMPDTFGENIVVWAPVDGLDALPVAINPTTPSDTMRTGEQSRTTDTQYALIQGYYPQITTAERLVVGDDAWTILMVDVDSQHSITRLKIQQVAS